MVPGLLKTTIGVSAKENLERQGYTTYLPVIRHPRRRLGRRFTAVEPLFPRYLFIYLDTQTDNWSPIRSTIGVSSLVRFGQRPAQVPTNLVEILMTRDDVSGIQKLPIKDFQPGDRVRVREGPMEGYEGIFLAKSSNERVMVLLDIVGNPVRISANPAHLQGAD